MMKKVTLAVFIIMMIPVTAFGRGNREKAPECAAYSVKVEEEGFPAITYEYDLAGGKNTLIIYTGTFQAAYGLCKTTNGSGSTVYMELSNGEILDTTHNSLYNTFFTPTAAPAAVTISEESKDNTAKINDLKASMGSYSGSEYSDYELARRSELHILYDIYCTDKEYDILLVNLDGSKYYRMKFSLTQEFFPGEYNLFTDAAVSAYSYEQKALAVLGCAAGDDFISAYPSMGLDVSMNTASWNMFDGIIKDTDKAALRWAMSEYFERIDLKVQQDDKSVEYPYLSTESMSESIYGDDANIYLKAYSTYAFFKNKPILNQLYTDIFARTKTAYKWKSYRAPTEEESIALARNALRYFTWGVEYTPFEGYEYSLYARNMNLIWNRMKDNDAFMGWINGSENGDREKNYLNHTLYSVTDNSYIMTRAKTSTTGSDNDQYKNLTVIGTDTDKHIIPKFRKIYTMSG